MKISTLRKIYPYLSKNIKNKKWRSLTDAELERSMKEKQVIANCYDEATRYALLATEKGRDLLKKRLKIEKGAKLDPEYKVKLNINGKEEVYRATRNDYYGKCSSIYNDYSETPGGLKSFTEEDSRLSLGVSTAIQKMITKHPSMKPFASRLYLKFMAKNRNCEFNKPSNAFKWFTGKNPEQIGESGININLVNNKNKVLETLGRLKRKTAKDYSYVAITGPFGIKVRNINSDKTKIDAWHCLPIIQVSKNNVYMKNLRTNEVLKVSYDEFLKKFKGLVGLDH